MVNVISGLLKMNIKNTEPKWNLSCVILTIVVLYLDIESNI